ncbi:class I SAM-dependent methyltransferase [Roseicyclus mahoneyensis]|uniref:Methyltransferase family protein n=1 Tax=Roseicyclus mahoneyensis TaxID=164332 RepID=A0A316GHW2_9RHOB|nr:class I SAM-dependent methyltransferase [Roseicyclus mahoneyensis]PWK60160.1 methyltransferase family protein [Roseicyclus mahoneyensis]
MTGAGNTTHWDSVYGAREEEALTWFEDVPGLSLSLIRDLARPEDPVIDIGGGASRLVDHLLGEGYRDITVLDLSETALDASRGRLGDRADRVGWIVGDVTQWRPDSAAYALWHDRAAFHFLTEPDQRAAYVARMAAALRPGGHAIIMTFAEDGPERCSNLPVQRYSPDTLSAEVGRHAPGLFTAVQGARHMHPTPKGAVQAFGVTVLRRGAQSSAD